ncbi:hypothetical protein LCGC14_2582610 [marine sediment metagenome]|uniref:HTH cro/C1-type domain-containing protein n=1 Tax=marine sediment metagenome TaxID=412755 RepID=A0A0F9AEF6_9ZZZZ
MTTKELDLRETLISLRLTQKEFADMCEISLRTMQRWVERGYPSALAQYVLDDYMEKQE